MGFYGKMPYADQNTESFALVRKLTSTQIVTQSHRLGIKKSHHPVQSPVQNTNPVYKIPQQIIHLLVLPQIPQPIRGSIYEAYTLSASPRTLWAGSYLVPIR